MPRPALLEGRERFHLVAQMSLEGVERDGSVGLFELGRVLTMRRREVSRCLLMSLMLFCTGAALAAAPGTQKPLGRRVGLQASRVSREGLRGIESP